ncbi:pyruvate dehydrogenase (acetyl-transferring) E1 component subunit alpha [Amycolatopsis acidicola]|uniref:Pyruvate dehydrogenase (Acetyl-transferring) E1 component subunit alpha n=1 Tax=Amycolatopsis acidicola TaxID=2596893 RepID=A0A5N0URT3_9PSEU|nr:thiamine pyrophosphate-dependent enzyme [Amycolatopsis acidicola]KAA9152163.1 pyruvate dehydrogenase (acetyl-transferring) E1 component subunit alpha [Amycolatopsis acidicola]
MNDRSTRAKKRAELLRQMIRIRRFDERLLELGGTVRPGEEALATGVLQSVGADDPVVSLSLEPAHALVRGVAMDELLGGGRIVDAGLRFYGGRTAPGTGLTFASGLALSIALQRRPLVTVCLFSDGGVRDAELHETLSLASQWRLPMLFCCENDLSAPEASRSDTELAMHAASYGIPAWAVDGMDVLAVVDAAERAVEAIRAGEGPHFLELYTYRFRGMAEVARWREFDPIPLLVSMMCASDEIGLEEAVTLESEVDSEVGALARG